MTHPWWLIFPKEAESRILKLTSFESSLQAESENVTSFLWTIKNLQHLFLPYVLYDSLGGGGVASIRPDPQGKAYAQLLSDYEIVNE